MKRFGDNSGDDTGEDAVDISPLIDVVFILLIFFIVTTTIIQERGHEVDRPQPASSEPQDENKSIVLRVTNGGDVLHEGRNIGISGIRPLVRDRLREQEVPVIVQAEQEAVTEWMMRVIDEARLAGAEKISLANL